MANPLKLPFDFPPNSTPTTQQIQANFNALLAFVQDLNDGVTALTNLLVNTLTTTSTALIGGALTTSSTALISGDLTASTVVKLANGSVSVPSLQFTNSPTMGLYRIGANNVGMATDATSSLTIDADGNLNIPQQPDFLATLDGGLVSITYTGELSPVVFSTEVFDIAGNYNPATGIFTAPITGKYFFYSFFPTQYGGGNPTTLIEMTLITSNRPIPGGLSSLAAGDKVGLAVATLCDMDAGDTAQIRVRPETSTSTWLQPINIQYNGAGVGSTRQAIFSGMLVN